MNDGSKSLTPSSLPILRKQSHFHGQLLKLAAVPAQLEAPVEVGSELETLLSLLFMKQGESFTSDLLLH